VEIRVNRARTRPTIHRARTRPGEHVDPKCDSLTRDHPNNNHVKFRGDPRPSGGVRKNPDKTDVPGPRASGPKIRLLLPEANISLSRGLTQNLVSFRPRLMGFRLNYTGASSREWPGQLFDPSKTTRDPKRPYLGPTTST